MAVMNRCEAEVDVIRIKLHEQTKHMTTAEHTRWSNERAQRLAAQYGFKIGKPSSKQERELIDKNSILLEGLN